jgi:phytoene synthase
VIADLQIRKMYKPNVAASYAACETIARRAASSFYPMFRFLPAAQRRGMCAIYAFLRIADDISDDLAAVDDKRRRLGEWRANLQNALASDYHHPIDAALHDTLRRFEIPSAYLVAALDGVEMDLVPSHYATFGELRKYCYHVASVVGLACIHIWGFAKPQLAQQCAVDAGIAFQLTNILRDLGEDAGNERVYLPQEDFERFGYSPERLKRGERDDRFRELMSFEIARARAHYDAAWPLASLLQPAGRAAFLAMARTYRALLDAIEERDYDVFSERVRVSRWCKLLVAMRSLPARWAW